MSIASLMDVPPINRGASWLQQALQWAVQLEFATIPPYLCGMWSIIDEGHFARRYLSSIVLQEMLHMGLACNMLSTLGEVPKIDSTAPKYPGPLPGGVRPQLRVWLAGFSRAMVRGVYMEIEYPEKGPITHFLGRTYPTIGDFYEAILAAFKNLPASAIKKERQLVLPGLGGPGLFPIQSLDDAFCAIKTIKEQGEGTGQDPYPSEDPSDRAHYYRFAELYFGRQLIKKDGKWQYAGDEIDLPPAYPMAEVPETGYGNTSRQFNEEYTAVLKLLQAAWERRNGQKCLDKAVLLMPALGGLARELMKKDLPEGSGKYGPDFRPVPEHTTPC